MPKLFLPEVVFKDFFEILKFLPVTLKISFFAMIFGLALGFLLAIIRMKKIPVLKQISNFYISVIRGTPILVQLYVTYFGIPILIKYLNYWYGWNLKVTNIPSIVYALAALAMNQAAFYSVTIQSALQSVNKGELEAASSLGMTGFQRMILITIPEALELALPSLGNTVINLVKGTSLAFSCSIVEMTAQGKIIAGSDFRYFEAYIALGIIYWLITIVIERIISIILKVVAVPDEPKGTKRKLTDIFRARFSAEQISGTGA